MNKEISVRLFNDRGVLKIEKLICIGNSASGSIVPYKR